MGILDDAIKEHLELKRQHGAGDDELKKLEDEAFGAAERPGAEGSSPDPLAEAPTEFMAQPDLEQAPESREDAPAVPEAAVAEPVDDEAAGRRSARAEIADLQEPPPEPQQEPAEEASPAAEHEIPSGPTTEEREAIAEQPTEMYDVEEELAASRTEEPAEGKEALEEEEYEEDDDFWDEKRLSDELDQALEAPSDDEEEDSVFEGDDSEPEYEDEPAAEDEPASEEPPAARKDEDVLEETPDFLEEAPEDDQLWFEQKPPKDFDFDD